MPKISKIVDLYPKNRMSSLDMQLFANPTSEYRGTPFWSWNAKLDKDQLFRQIDQLKEMGFGGGHIHSRTGLDTAYLSDEFMDVVKACTEKFKSENMISWLYDEDRWPSGSAGGLVTKDHKFRARHLLWTCTPYSGLGMEAINNSAAQGRRNETGTLLAKYEVTIQNGCLASYRRLNETEQPSGQGKIWYAYLEVHGNAPWFNNQAYVDTLNPLAIKKFIEITHERYRKAVGEYFGSVVPAIFTDEPQFTHKGYFRTSDDTRDLTLPFTDDFFATYEKAYKQKLEDFLPELFWELPDGNPSLARYRYHDHVAERFAVAFSDTVGKWCEKHGIALTGHLMEEPTLQSQTAAVGDAMRSYRSFHLPGIDMLCDLFEYTTAKQAQSATHQYGYPGVLSELYGVTNWDFDFNGHKGQGDWQAALGVTVRVPHLAWVSMAGEAKRDYPAAIGYQSPWYKEYKYVEDYFSRINTVLTRGNPLVRVGVVHPVESYWLDFGPAQQTKLQREDREQAFQNITNWLLFGLIDFNFICESTLPQQCKQQVGDKFTVGKMAYETVIVPAMRTIRLTTLKRLEAFAKAGGQIIFAGEIPSLVDAIPSERCKRLAKKCLTINLARPQLLKALAPQRDLEIFYTDGNPAWSILYQLRVDGDARHLFLCNTSRQQASLGSTVRIRGSWSLTKLDAFTGQSQTMSAEVKDGWTSFKLDLPATGSLLITLNPGNTQTGISLVEQNATEFARIADPVPVTLSEPNVLMLDIAQWRWNDGPWQPAEEVLRIGNLARHQAGLGDIEGGIAQPWTDDQSAPELGKVILKFTIESDVPVAGALLAIEQPENATITLDDQMVANTAIGYWTDESIKTLRLPDFSAGKHELLIQIPLTRKTMVEWCYLLGDFGVTVAGRYARITAPVRQLAFGNFTTQGLPFYGGNVTYHCQLQGIGGEMAIQTPQFKSPLISASLDGRPAGKIAFPPFQIRLGPVSNGTHKLDLTVFGNRINCFGGLHDTTPGRSWTGPDTWRTNGSNWAYEYQLKPMGLLTAPIIMRL